MIIARCAWVLVVIATLLFIAEVDAKLSAHDLIIVQVAHSGRSRIYTRWSDISKSWGFAMYRNRTGVRIVCESESLGSSSLRIVHKTESLDFAGAAENIGDLLLSESLGNG